MEITPVSSRISLIDTLALGQKGTVAVYLLRGSKIAVVDCGYSSSYGTILESLKDLGITPSEVSYLIPTHVHLDHAGGAGYLVREMPNAQVVAHENAVPHLIDPTKLVQSATRIFGEEIMQLYGLPLPISEDRILSVGNETALDLGEGLTLTALHTPGHAPHQISLLLDREKILITADAVGIVYHDVPTLIPTTPPPSFDLSGLIGTVNELAQLNSNALLVPHFGVRKDVSNVFEATKSKVESWVSKVRIQKNRGLGLEEITEAMKADVVEEAGIRADDLPIYAYISIRISVMGILHYLERSI